MVRSMNATPASTAWSSSLRDPEWKDADSQIAGAGPEVSKPSLLVSVVGSSSTETSSNPGTAGTSNVSRGWGRVAVRLGDPQAHSNNSGVAPATARLFGQVAEWNSFRTAVPNSTSQQIGRSMPPTLEEEHNSIIHANSELDVVGLHFCPASFLGHNIPRHSV